jgi:hypothetical protein
MTCTALTGGDRGWEVLPSRTFQQDAQKEKCPLKGHFILAETYFMLPWRVRPNSNS